MEKYQISAMKGTTLDIIIKLNWNFLWVSWLTAKRRFEKTESLPTYPNFYWNVFVLFSDKKTVKGVFARPTMQSMHRAQSSFPKTNKELNGTLFSFETKLKCVLIEIYFHLRDAHLQFLKVSVNCQ